MAGLDPLRAAGRKLKYSPSTANIAFDGNSLVEGFGAATPLPAQLAGAWPLAGTGMTVTNLGVGGQTWQDMQTNSADVDAAWVSGRVNILIAWETTNAVFNTARTAPQVAADTQTYISARLAAHPWKVVLMTTIPRQVNGDQTATTANNLVLESCDDLFRQHYREWGAVAVVDVRAPGSPFRFAAYDNAAFSGSDVDSLWHESIGSRIHLNDQGYGVVAKMIGRTLARLAA